MKHHGSREQEQEDLEEVLDTLDQWGLALSPQVRKGLQGPYIERNRKNKTPRKLEDFK